MKYEFKISTLSIVCVLCAAMSAPAFGAPAVRSLGGAGTYVGSTGATAAKATDASKPATATVKSVRGGSMRVNPSATSGATSTRASSTRASSTPRLSIGKYLSGSSTAVSGTVKPVDPELSSGNLQTRIEVLEDYLGYTEGDTPLKAGVAAMELDIAKLKQDLSEMLGVQIDVVYGTDGVLTITRGSDTIVSEKFVTAAELQSALNDAVDGVVTSDMLDVVEKDIADIKSEVSTLTEADKALQDAIDALESAQGGTDSTTAELSDQIEDLQTAQESLQTVVDGLASKDFVEGTYVDSAVAGAVADLTAADDLIKQMIEDLQGGNTTSLSELATAIEELKSADTGINTAVEAIVADVTELQTTMADVEKALKTFTTTEITNDLTERLVELETKLADVDLSSFATIADLNSAKNELSKTITDIQTALSNQHQDDIKALTDQHAADIKELNDALEALKSAGVVTNATFAALQDKVSEIEADYATDGEVSKAVAAARDALQELIDANTIAIAANASDIATNASAIAKNAADIATNTSAIALVKTTAESAVELANSNATEIEKLKPVAYSGLYSDLDGLPVLITEDDLTKLQDAMIKRMNELHANGDYATAKEFAELVSEVGTLKTGSASQETVKQLQADVEALYKDYATKAELTKAEENLNSTIASLGTRVTANEEAIAKLQEAMAKKVDSATLATTVQELVNENEITIPIADGSITTAKLADGAVTSGKMSIEGFKTGQMAMFMNYNGVGEWVLVNVAGEGDVTE